MLNELTDNAQLYYVNRASPIAFADHSVVKRLLDDMEVKGLIIPIIEASGWATPLVVIDKSDTHNEFASTIQS